VQRAALVVHDAHGHDVALRQEGVDLVERVRGDVRAGDPDRRVRMQRERRPVRVDVLHQREGDAVVRVALGERRNAGLVELDIEASGDEVEHAVDPLPALQGPVERHRRVGELLPDGGQPAVGQLNQCAGSPGQESLDGSGDGGGGCRGVREQARLVGVGEGIRDQLLGGLTSVAVREAEPGPADVGERVGADGVGTAGAAVNLEPVRQEVAQLSGEGTRLEEEDPRDVADLVGELVEEEVRLTGPEAGGHNDPGAVAGGVVQPGGKLLDGSARLDSGVRHRRPLSARAFGLRSRLRRTGDMEPAIPARGGAPVTPSAGRRQHERFQKPFRELRCRRAVALPACRKSPTAAEPVSRSE
jgi:hypothetical protein